MRYALPVILVLALIVAVLMVTAPSHPRADFTFINRGIISTLDPAAMSWMQDIRLALTIWEGLYTYDPRTSEPIPGTAFPAEISPDQRTYTFRIRPEACWENGDPVTARDFTYAWRRAFEPGTARDYAFFFEMIEGVKDYVAWRIGQTQRIAEIKDPLRKRAERDHHLAEADQRFDSQVAIQALDEKTLRVRLVRPVAYFLDLCAFSTFLPVHVASIERFKVIGDDGLIYYSEQWTKPGNTHYNGPFFVTDWAFKRHIRMERNPHYWNHQAVKLRTLEQVEVEDANTTWLLYAGGQVDWVTSIDTSYVPKLIASSGSPLPGAINRTGRQRSDIHAFPAFGTYFYNFNCKDKLPDGRPNPFRDRRVRQAFTMAVDKQRLVDQVVRQGNPPATTFIPPGSIPNYPAVQGLPHDPQRARRLLAEAGFPEARGFPEVVILFNTGFQHGDIAQAVIGMWQRELGIRGRVQGMEGKTFREEKKNVNYIICRASWYGDYGDPTTFLDMFQTTNGNNDSGFTDPQYDRMLADAELEIDPLKRLEKLAEIERYLVNDALPLLPLYVYVNTYAFNPDKVRNLYLTPRMMTMLRVVEVTR